MKTIHKIFIWGLFLWPTIILAQNFTEMDSNKYEVINKVFGEKVEVDLMEITSINKTWYLLMNTEDFFDGLMGPPCNFNGQYLDQDRLIDGDKMKTIRKQILNSVSLQLDSSKVNDNIRLVSSKEYGRPGRQIEVINTPIIIDDLAVLRRYSKTSETIYILKYIDNNWVIVCDKNTFAINED